MPYGSTSFSRLLPGFLLWLLVLAAPAAGQPRDQSGLDATVWMQTAAEYHALARQAYRGAEAALDRALADPNWTAILEQTNLSMPLRPAVILDLDETVLDNTPFQAKLVKEGLSYTDELWEAWVREKKAGLVPGALEFLLYARLRGVTPIYITNRVCQPESAQDATVEVLQKLHVPFAKEYLYCRKSYADTSAKGPRRFQVTGQFRVLAVIGDDLNDFLTIPPAQANVAERARLMESYGRFFGDRWFVIPNPDYGSWERAVGFSQERKLEALRQ